LKLLKNRIFLSALCLILAAGVSFFLLPHFYESKNATVTVLRAAADIPAGTEIQDKHLVSAEVGSYGLPEGIIKDKALIVVEIAQTDIAKGDYFFPKNLAERLPASCLTALSQTISVGHYQRPSIAGGIILTLKKRRTS
jgi:pilus assembly protein CpaB